MRRSPALPLLILDCDGVLIRSERANLAYYNHLFRAFGLPEVDEHDRERVLRLHTLSTPQVIDAFFPPELRDRAREFAREVDYARFVPLLEAEPGWHEVLAERAGFERVAVATNRGRSARAVLDAVGLLPLVDRVVTVEEVARPKPHPDLLHRCLEVFGVPPAGSVYVGDSDLDRRAAAATGIPFVGFGNGGAPAIREPRELGPVLGKLAQSRSFGSIRGQQENP